MYSVSVGSADGSSEHVPVGSVDASVPVGVGTFPESDELPSSFPLSEPSFGPSSEPSSPVHVLVGAELSVVLVALGTSVDEPVGVGTPVDEPVEDEASGVGESVPVTVALRGAEVTLKLAASS
jgi:hypothetical protein